MIKPDEITPGIYFNLDEATYHAAPWLGSSNMKQLYASPPDYWFESAMNPMREPDKPSPAQNFGKALHHCILFGDEAFKRDYLTLEKENADGSWPAEALKEFLEQHGIVPTKLKSENEALLAASGLNVIGKKHYDRILISHQMIVKNPHLAQAFTNGLPEVSIFWEQPVNPETPDNVVRCKARFDYLKMRAIVDLKSYGDKQRIRTLDEIIINDIFSYRYDVQLAHYMNGHRAAKELVKAGMIFCCDEKERVITQGLVDWLNKAFDKEPDWVFVFYKREGMPIAKSYQCRWEGPAHGSGKVAVDVALRAYEQNIERFGTDPWVNLDEPYTIENEDLPKWL